MTHRNPLILPILLLLLLVSVTLPAANRSTCPTFGSKTITAISRTASITKRPQEIYIAFHWEITVIRFFTHHPSLITHHVPQGHTYTHDHRLSGYTITSGTQTQIIQGTQY